MLHHMTTKNPRLSITLQPSFAALLKRLSQLTGNSQSHLVADLLESNELVFSRMVKVLEAAELVKTSAKTETAQRMDNAQSLIESQLGLVLDMFDTSTAPLLQEAERVARRAGRRGDATGARAATHGVMTPPSNRGVRSDPKQTKKSINMRLSKELKQKSYKHQKLDKSTVKKGVEK